mgnify:CR=1 FL=1
MLFRNEESSLRLDIVNYEFPPDGGDPTSDDRNWLVLRATWNKEDGDVVKDSNSCLPSLIRILRLASSQSGLFTSRFT